MSPIDWNKNARSIVNQVRGLIPWPCATTEVAGVRWKVYRAEEAGAVDCGAPGKILSADKGGIVVAAGEGTSVRITELQADGGRRMSAGDYLRGHPIQL